MTSVNPYSSSPATEPAQAEPVGRVRPRRGGWDSGMARGLGEDDVVTGDAVVVEMPVARVASRCGAALIDRLLYLMIILAIIGVFMPVLESMDKAALQGVLIVGSVTMLVIMPTVWETVSRGRTPGKIALGLRTVRTDAGAVTFRHCLTRHLVGVVELNLLGPFPALACAFFSSRSRRLGDLAAGTVVVRDRLVLPSAYVCAMPPSMQQWAAHADIAMVPDDLAVKARTVLVRASTMSGDAVEGWVRTFAEEMRQVTSPPPPPGTSDVDFLRAVLAERHTRELRTLSSQESLRTTLMPLTPETP